MRQPYLRWTPGPAWLLVALLLIAFALGLGSGYVLWGRPPASEAAPQASDSSPTGEPPAEQVSPVGQINPPNGYPISASLGDVGPRLLAAGAIDYDRFLQVYEQAGRPLSEGQLNILTKGSDAPIVIDRDNAYFLLNFFWALGLT